jgi:uncharacterized membrane protein YoaK (UPF0700 family)
MVLTFVPPAGDRHGPLPPLMLKVVTGIVDAVSYLGPGHVFVANMTGNVVFLGFALAGAHGLSAVASIVSLAAFLLGALAGGRLGTRQAAHRGRLLAIATCTQTILVAAALLTSVAAHGRVTAGVQYTLLVVLGLGMRLQNAVARRLSVPDMTTIALTLTLTGLAADSTTASGEAPRPGRRILSVLMMFLGALIGAQLLLHALLSAAMGLALVLLVVISVIGCRISASHAPWTGRQA